MNRTIRLIALTNDAMGLAAGNFCLPIYSWKAMSQNTQQISSQVKNKTWQLRVRNLRELIGLNIEDEYLTIHDRLSGLPQGYSWKIEQALCLFEEEDNIRLLEWQRDTIHKSYSTEDEYQRNILTQCYDVWEILEEYYKGFPEIQLKNYRPSIMVLEKIDGDEELASNIDLLLQIRSMLWSENNPISKSLYEIMWRVERKRGTWEYEPYLEAS